MQVFMNKRISWPSRYQWMHEYALSMPGAELEFKPSWDALLYRLHGKIFLLLLRNKTLGKMANLKCDPYLSLALQGEYASIIPGWHMNKLHWVSLVLKGYTPEGLCRQLVRESYSLVREALPRKIIAEQVQLFKVDLP